MTKPEEFILQFLQKTRPKEIADAEENWKSLQMSDLAIDSLDLTILSLDIQEEFGSGVGAEEIADVPTAGDLIALIEERTSGSI